ncbi:MAG: endonuclease [Clostridia bacterium]|nr:endonuclease [Clostridia bacterium]
MKKLTLKVSAVMLILSIMLSFTVVTGTAAAPASYSSSSNSGTRDVVCTSLSGTSAAEYYTGSYTYDALSQLSASQLKSSLSTLMRSTHSKRTSYDACRDYADKTDCQQNRDTTIVTLYTSFITSDSQYNSGSGWNREHVWPQSLGGGNTSGGGADMHHIRPSENKTNGTRGNKKYGNVSSGTSVSGNLSGDVGGTYSGNYFEPLDNVKGDVARICLYVYVRWGSDWGAESITEVFQSVDVLLEWCELDPVDTWEMGRNEVVEAIQGNRNVFIDYPEFAWLIFGKSVPDDMQTPSGMAMSGNAGGNTGGDTTGGDNTGGDSTGGDSTGGDTTGGGSTGDPECQHTTTEIKNASAATCSKAGYTGDKYCASCGAKLMNVLSIEKLAHTESDWISDKEATATEQGSRHTVCSVCGVTVRTEAILPTDSVSAFAAAVELVKSSETMLARYTYAVMALDVYAALDDAERETVDDLYTELSALLDGYNSDAEAANSSHKNASTVILFIATEQVSAIGYAILPSKENA